MKMKNDKRKKVMKELEIRKPEEQLFIGCPRRDEEQPFQGYMNKDHLKDHEKLI